MLLPSQIYQLERNYRQDNKVVLKLILEKQIKSNGYILQL